MCECTCRLNAKKWVMCATQKLKAVGCVSNFMSNKTGQGNSGGMVLTFSFSCIFGHDSIPSIAVASTACCWQVPSVALLRLVLFCGLFYSVHMQCCLCLVCAQPSTLDMWPGCPRFKPAYCLIISFAGDEPRDCNPRRL